jgi:hypothetical protein
VQQLVLKAAAHDVFAERTTLVHRHLRVSVVVAARALPELRRHTGQIEYVFARHQDIGEEAGVAIIVVYRPGAKPAMSPAPAAATTNAFHRPGDWVRSLHRRCLFLSSFFFTGGGGGGMSSLVRTVSTA